MDDEELEAFEEVMEAQAEELKEALAEDLGGEPEENRSESERAADGGEE